MWRRISIGSDIFQPSASGLLDVVGLGDGELMPGVDGHAAVAAGRAHAGPVIVAARAVPGHVNLVLI